MVRTMPMIEARNKLTRLPEEFQKESGAVAVTRRGMPVLAVLPWELYESLVETLEIMGDAKMMESVRRGIKEMEAGKGIPWSRAKRELDL